MGRCDTCFEQTRTAPVTTCSLLYLPARTMSTLACTVKLKAHVRLQVVGDSLIALLRDFQLIGKDGTPQHLRPLKEEAELDHG